MKKKVLISLMFIIMLIGINYIIDNNSSATKTISYNGNNLRISIDGEVSSTLPTSGNYYLVDYDCKSSNTKVEWIKYTDDNNEVQYKLNVSNGTKKSGVICNLEFKSNPLLSEMPVGSYVAYTGDNNCDNTNVNGWTSCMGKNANYVSDTDMGYCGSSSDYKFHVNGWRLAYVEDGSPHLISAGATDCMCTGSNGVSLSSGCNSYLGSTDLVKHFDNMNFIALKYCNNSYSKGGVCDITTSWGMNAVDFAKITNNALNDSSCYLEYSDMSCGYTNDLIDNGGYYWFATSSSASSSDGTFNWDPYNRFVSNYFSGIVYGVRPVLALESSIRVMGGDGTYSNPYIINNDYFEINNGSKYISNNDNISQVQLSLNSFGDATKMCISVNTSVCTNYINYSDTYTLDFSSETAGVKTVYVYFKDSNDEIVASMNRSISIPLVDEDFSDTTYDSNITITGGATYPWSVVNSRFESTCQNVNSGNSSSTIQIIPTIAAKMSFDYGVSSEQNYDKLTITLTGSDGSSNIIANAISGITTGSATDIELTAGVTYTLTLSYKKDGSVNKNDDIGYIDNLLIY